MGKVGWGNLGHGVIRVTSTFKAVLAEGESYNFSGTVRASIWLHHSSIMELNERILLI